MISSNNKIFKPYFPCFFMVFMAILLMGQNVWGASVKEDTLWNTANTLYQNNAFDEAIQHYQAILDQDKVSASLYFNLGNAYFKNNDIKQAILNYERALRLSPNDEDIEYNLQMANTMITDKIEAMDEVFVITWLKHFRNLFPVDTWAWMSVVSFGLGLLLFFFFLMRSVGALKYVAFWMGVVCMAFFLCAGVAGYYRYKQVSSKSEAIVFTATVTVKSSPDVSGNSLFILHEGSKVKIEDTIGEWCEVRISDGHMGWVKMEDLSVI